MTEAVEVLRAELQSIRTRGDSEPPVPPPPPPAPGDDGGLRAQLTRLEQALTEGLAWMPPTLPEGLADRADIAGLRAQIDALGADGGRGRVDLQPLQEHLDRLHEQVDALAHQVAGIPTPDLRAVQAQLDRLGQRLDGLPGRDQLARTLAPQLDAILAAARPDDVLDAIDTTARSLRDQIAGIGDLSPVVRQAFEPMTAQLERLVTSDVAVREDLALTSEVLVGLTRLTEATEAHLAELASHPASDRQALATGAVKDVAQALSRQVRQLETQVEGLSTRLVALGDGVTAHLDDATEELRSLGVASLRTAMTELVQHVVDGRAQDRELLEAVLTLDERVTELHQRALTSPTPTALEAPPGPAPATAADLDVARASLADSIGLLGAHLEAEQRELEARVAELIPPPPEPPAPDPAIAGMQAAVGGLAEDLAELRTALERRPAGRRRRRGGDEPAVEPQPVGPSDLEQRVDQALAAMDSRLAVLTDQVEQAAGHARDAAAAARAALTGVMRASPPAPAPARAPAAKKAPVKTAGKTASKTTRSAAKVASKAATKTATKAAAGAPKKRASGRTRS